MFKRKIKEPVEGEYQKPPKEPMSKTKKIAIAVVSFSLGLFIAIAAFFFTMFYVQKDYEYVADFVNLPDPVQVETTGEETKYIDDYEIKMEFKAEYTLCGLVVEKYHYFPYKMINKLSQYDFGIVWGPLLGENIDELMSFRNKGNRFLHYTYSNALTAKLGSKEAVTDSLSNNHMIHADNHVLKLFRNVKEGDYIKIEGYLVYVSYENSRSRGTWNSSLVRNDHGDGACEIIYVENVTWLKEK